MRDILLQRSGLAVLATGGLVVLGLSVTAGRTVGQDNLMEAETIAGERGRVLYPAQSKLESDDAERILYVLETVAPTSGLPVDYAQPGSVTVSLARKGVPGLDGWTSVEKRLIVLPLERAIRWPEEKLRNVLEHEMAHIAVFDFFGVQGVLPAWFEEGFAEWTAGGLSCEGHIRLEIEVRRRVALGLLLPSVDSDWEALPARLAYDVAASFVGFIAGRLERGKGIGKMMDNVKTHGWQSGVEMTLGVGLDVLEAAWQAEVEEKVRQVQVYEECGEVVGYRRLGKGPIWPLSRLQPCAGCWVPLPQRVPRLAEPFRARRGRGATLSSKIGSC